MTASMDEEAPAMESMRWVGVDVHAKESLAAVLDPATGEINTQRISGRPVLRASARKAASPRACPRSSLAPEFPGGAAPRATLA